MHSENKTVVGIFSDITDAKKATDELHNVGGTLLNPTITGLRIGIRRSGAIARQRLRGRAMAAPAWLSDHADRRTPRTRRATSGERCTPGRCRARHWCVV